MASIVRLFVLMAFGYGASAIYAMPHPDWVGQGNGNGNGNGNVGVGNGNGNQGNNNGNNNRGNYKGNGHRGNNQGNGARGNWRGAVESPERISWLSDPGSIAADAQHRSPR